MPFFPTLLYDPAGYFPSFLYDGTEATVEQVYLETVARGATVVGTNSAAVAELDTTASGGTVVGTNNANPSLLLASAAGTTAITGAATSQASIAAAGAT